MAQTNNLTQKLKAQKQKEKEAAQATRNVINSVSSQDAQRLVALLTPKAQRAAQPSMTGGGMYADAPAQPGAPAGGMGAYAYMPGINQGQLPKTDLPPYSNAPAHTTAPQSADAPAGINQRQHLPPYSSAFATPTTFPAHTTAPQPIRPGPIANAVNVIGEELSRDYSSLGEAITQPGQRIYNRLAGNEDAVTVAENERRTNLKASQVQAKQGAAAKQQQQQQQQGQSYAGTGEYAYADEISKWSRTMPTYLKPVIVREVDGDPVIEVRGQFLTKFMQDIYSAGEENARIAMIDEQNAQNWRDQQGNPVVGNNPNDMADMASLNFYRAAQAQLDPVRGMSDQSRTTIAQPAPGSQEERIVAMYLSEMYPNMSEAELLNWIRRGGR